MNYSELKLKMRETKSEMTSSERMGKYFAGEEVDHIPYNLLSIDEALCEIYGYKTSEMYNDFNIYAEIIERGREELDIHGVTIGLGLRTLGAAMGSTLIYPESGFNRIEEYILKDYSDWDKLAKIDPYNNKILTPMLERAAKVRERFPDITLSTSVVGPISNAVAVRQIEKVLRDTRKNPERLKELLFLVVDNSLKWVEVFTKEFGQAPASFADPVTCTDILSRKQFEEFSLPEMKRLATGLKNITSSKPSLHICGHTKGLWEDLKDMDLSTFSVDNCEDLEEVREVLGDTMTIVGNVPPVDVLRSGSIDDVIESVKSCIQKGATSPKGYILSSGCQVPIGTPKENFQAFIYAARKYGRGAKIGEMPLGMI